MSRVGELIKEMLLEDSLLLPQSLCPVIFAVSFAVALLIFSHSFLYLISPLQPNLHKAMASYCY